MTRCKITGDQIAGLSHVKEITLFVVCYIIYLLTKDLLFDQSTALQNSLLILDIERRFGILQYYRYSTTTIVQYYLGIVLQLDRPCAFWRLLRKLRHT